MNIIFEQFKDQWLNTLETIHVSFSRKLFADWIDIDVNNENISNVDDEFIDVVYLQDSQFEEVEKERTLYLVSSNTEGKDAVSRVDSIHNFIRNNQETKEFYNTITEKDKIIYVIASKDQTINSGFFGSILTTGKQEINSFFFVESISIKTIYERLSTTLGELKFTVDVNLQKSSENIYIGSFKLLDLYNFMLEYEKETNDIDKLYEKNVRKYLGAKKKVNRDIRKTIILNPEDFCLYNNGITFVAKIDSNSHTNFRSTLINPYIVNGAQTTKTLWETFKTNCHTDEKSWKKLTKQFNVSTSYDTWKQSVKESLVVVKMVSAEQSKINDITRYTNSQTAVTSKDFMALDNSFVTWQKAIAENYNIYLEIQRGGSESQRVIQAENTSTTPFFKENEFANAFDLIKIFAAGWLGETGLAYNATPPFAPGGAVFEKIINGEIHKSRERDGNIREIEIKDFNHDDLYAVCLLNHEAIFTYKFGRGADNSSRGFTRYLFYYTVIEIIRDIILSNNQAIDTKIITKALLRLFSKPGKWEISQVLENAAYTIDEYFTAGTENCVYKDPEFGKQNHDIVKILKMSEFGKTKYFKEGLSVSIRSLKRPHNGKVPYNEIANILKTI